MGAATVAAAAAAALAAAQEAKAAAELAKASAAPPAKKGGKAPPAAKAGTATVVDDGAKDGDLGISLINMQAITLAKNMQDIAYPSDVYRGVLHVLPEQKLSDPSMMLDAITAQVAVSAAAAAKSRGGGGDNAPPGRRSLRRSDLFIEDMQDPCAQGFRSKVSASKVVFECRA